MSIGTSACTRCVANRFSGRWLPQYGILPVRLAAPVDAPPSQFVRAPSTEFAYTTADDSIHATCSPRTGRLPTWYGVHVARMFTPRSL